MKIILISGKAQHGKDTTAGFLRDELIKLGVPERRILVTHYADLLKWVAKNYFAWDGEKDAAGRSLLQMIGQKVRQVMPDYWCNAVWQLIKAFSDGWDYVLVPDVRYPNELLAPINLFNDTHDAEHWRVVRPNFDNGLTEEQKSHESETALDKSVPDRYICNFQDLKHLSNLIADIAKELYHDYSNRAKQDIHKLEE